jgi:hypothetical protein
MRQLERTRRQDSLLEGSDLGRRIREFLERNLSLLAALRRDPLAVLPAAAAAAASTNPELVDGFSRYLTRHLDAARRDGLLAAEEPAAG